jgi:rod shape-determining protein MreC
MSNPLSRLSTAPPVTLRVLILVVASIALMLIDNRTQQLEKLRTSLHTLVYPVIFLSTIPGDAVNSLTRSMQKHSSLQEENEKLKQENLYYKSRFEKLYALEADIERLKRLLGQSEELAEKILLAELVEVSLEPYTQQIVLNKGTSDDVYIGQPVINGEGVIGQVVHTSHLQSIVTLLTDPDSAVPVMVMRNGLRGIMRGTGVTDKLKLPYLTADTDILVGDLLISSGMGGRFPTGYPVATITAIERDPSLEFLNIIATPVARLDHGREVLLIWPGNEQPAETVPEVTEESAPPMAVPLLDGEQQP